MGLNIAKPGTYPFVEGKLLRIIIVKQPKVRSYGFLHRILHQGHSLYWLHKSYCSLFVPVLYLPMFLYMDLYLLFNVACFSGLMYVEIVIVLLLLNEQALIDNGILQHIQYIIIHRIFNNDRSYKIIQKYIHFIYSGIWYKLCFLLCDLRRI